ncbi:MAG: hypothetical protein ACI971_000717 [Colwellia sp.]|jgi:hypothetical protein
MLELLFSQQGIVSFWLPLLAAFIIFILQLFVNKNKSGTRDYKPMTFNQVTNNVQNIYVKRPPQNYKKSRNNNDGAQGVLGLLLVATIFTKITKH